MDLSYQEKGKYFRGLLILIGKDNLIHEKERKKVLSIANNLGYEKKYCEEAIQNIISNPHVLKTPPKFTTLETANRFIQDAVNISLVDKELHPSELEWLEQVVEVNGINSDWFNSIVSSYSPNNN